MARTRRGRTFIKEWREHRGLTQVQLGNAIGVHHTNIGRLEKGTYAYNQDSLEAIARVLNTDVVSLLTRDPASPEDILTIWRRLSPEDQRRVLRMIGGLLT